MHPELHSTNKEGRRALTRANLQKDSLDHRWPWTMHKGSVNTNRRQGKRLSNLHPEIPTLHDEAAADVPSENKPPVCEVTWLPGPMCPAPAARISPGEPDVAFRL